MRKTPAVALMIVLAMLIGGGVPLLQAQNGGSVSGPKPAAADDLPRRTAKAFAPFLRAIIMRRINTAQQIFKVRRSVMNSLEQPETTRVLGRFQKPDTLSINLVGGRMLGQNIGILLFTMTNEEGPIYFKIYYYGVEDQIYIDRMDIGDDWDDMASIAASLDSLPAPINVPLGVIDEGGQ